MGAYINLYMNNPTAGGTDGTKISENGAQTSPLSVTLDATTGEVKALKCAIRCESGYKTSGSTKIMACFHNPEDGSYSETGGNVEKFKFSPANDYADAEDALLNAYWNPGVMINDVIENKNVNFWVKIIATEGEEPQNDTSTVIRVEGIIEPTGA